MLQWLIQWNYLLLRCNLYVWLTITCMLCILFCSIACFHAMFIVESIIINYFECAVYMWVTWFEVTCIIVLPLPSSTCVCAELGVAVQVCIMYIIIYKHVVIKLISAVVMFVECTHCCIPMWHFLVLVCTGFLYCTPVLYYRWVTQEMRQMLTNPEAMRAMMQYSREWLLYSRRLLWPAYMHVVYLQLLVFMQYVHCW